MSTPLLKLYKGSYTNEQLLQKCTEGAIVFDKSTNRIYAGTESSEPFMFGSNVQDATFANSILDIYKTGYVDDNTTPALHIKLDFHDIASASAMMAVFQSLYEKMGLSGNDHDQIDYSGTNYLSDLGTTGKPAKNLVNADKALDAAIKGIADTINAMDAIADADTASGNGYATITTTTPTSDFKVLNSITEVDGVLTAGEAYQLKKVAATAEAEDLSKTSNSTATYDTTATEISSTWVTVVNSNGLADGDTVDADLNKLDAKIAGLADELIRDEQVINQTVSTIADSIGLENDLSLDLSDDTTNIIKTDDNVKDALQSLADAIYSVSGDSVDDVKINGTSVVTTQTVSGVDKQIADFAVEGTYNASNNKIASETTVTNAINALDVTEYAQAQIDTDTNASTLKIKGIKETDGKIAAATTTPTFNVEIDGVYNASTNKVATKSTVTNAIQALDTQSDVQAVDYTAATSSTGAQLTFKGVSETDGVIAQGTGSTVLQFAKVATTGDAGDVAYTNSSSHLTATNAQAAIDELDTRIDALEGSFDVIISTSAATTPAGVKWMDGQTEITGTLAADATTWHKIYLVPSGSGKDNYQEYITLRTGTSPNFTYSWEKLGNTSVDLLGYVKTITLNGKSYPVDTNSTNVTLTDVITSIAGETAITGGESDLVSVTATTTKTTADGTNATVLASSVKVEEVADGLTKDQNPTYSAGHYVIENNKLVSAENKSTGDTYTISANDGLVKASDVKAYVDSSISEASFRWSEWS